MVEHPFAAVIGEGMRKHRAEMAALRDELIARHGTAENVWAPTAQEQSLAAAAAHLKGTVWKKFYNGSGDVDVLGGWFGHEREIPPDVQIAVLGAYPVPASIRDLREEVWAWERRDKERSAVLCVDGMEADTYLSLEASARYQLLRQMLRTRPPVTLDDVIVKLELVADDADGLWDPHKIAASIIPVLRALIPQA